MNILHNNKFLALFGSLILVAILYGCNSSNGGGSSSTTAVSVSNLNASLLGAQVNPPAFTSATGVASLLIDSNLKLAGSVSTFGMTGTSASISSGAVGTNGASVIALAETTPGSGIWAVPPNTTLTADQNTNMLAGNMYVNVNSVSFPTGQVRGQIGGPIVRTATLTGTQENPAITTAATGTGIISVNPTTKAVVARMTTTGIVGTAGHVHDGAIGVNGAIIVQMSETTAGSGVWVSAAGAALTDAQYASFLAGGLYFNVHSTANPGGQIRGQIGLNVIDFTMSAAQEVPTNTSTATATGRLILNPVTLDMSGVFTSTGLVSNNAHIHTGIFGVSGGVTFPFFVSPTNPLVWSMPTTNITNAQYRSLLAGDMYGNIHSAAFPGGEIRGQIGNVVRTGNLSGPGEVPVNTSTATGRGIASFNPVTLATTQSVVTTGITGTAGHIHTGALGATGGVTVPYTQSSPGVWNSSPFTFTAAQAAAFAADGMYFNIHSAAFPGGEIRAQASGRD